jgi:hypothetical protein
MIVIVFVLDVAARFFPLDQLSFRAWEPAVRYHLPCSPFRANFHYVNDLSYGDLAAMGNLPQYRHYRETIFSTDAFGFRRNSDVTGSLVKYYALLVGDSMIAGSALNDDETLPARLEHHLGRGVYNGGGLDYPPTLDQILYLVRRLNLTGGTILYEYFERHDLPPPHVVLSHEPGTTFDCRDWRTRLSIWYEGFIETSPLQIVAQKIFRKLQNDFLIPNASKAEVVVSILTNGEPILFYPPEIQRSRRKGPADVSGFKRLADELEKNGLRLVVILVPTKYTVYRPLLKDEETNEDTGYLNAVDASLKKMNVDSVNLLSPFQQKAREYYKEGSYIYWLDDVHWNAAGVELAAEEIVKRNVIH